MNLRRPSAMLLLALVACGSQVQVADGTSTGGGGAAGSGGSSASAGTCADWARGVCSNWTRCSPTAMVVQFGSDAERCRERHRLTCEAAFLTADSEATPAWLGACAQAYETSACDAYPTDCWRPPGRRLAGEACGGDEQCADGFCNIANDAPCGVCQRYAAAGEACTPSTRCEPGLGCMGSEPRCAAFLRIGETCANGMGAARCEIGTAWCSAGKCVLRLTIGASCDPEHDACDSNHLLQCDKQSRTCVAIHIPGPGEACDPGSNFGCAEAICDGSKCGEAIREGTACTMTADICFGWGLQCISGHCAIPALPQCN